MVVTGCTDGGGKLDDSSAPEPVIENQLADSLTNGSTLAEATSYWNCNFEFRGDTGSYTLQLFEDGSGTSSGVGDFTWEKTQREVEISALSGSFSIVYGIAYTGEGNIVTFSEFFRLGMVMHSTCFRTDI